jgi:hypothetical protein
MADFYNNLDIDDAEQVEQLSRLMFELRTSRDTLLKTYGVSDASGLLALIRAGSVAEHPAYEHFLSLRILDDTRESVRDELKAFLPKVRPI